MRHESSASGGTDMSLQQRLNGRRTASRICWRCSHAHRLDGAERLLDRFADLRTTLHDAVHHEARSRADRHGVAMLGGAAQARARGRDGRARARATERLTTEEREPLIERRRRRRARLRADRSVRARPVGHRDHGQRPRPGLRRARRPDPKTDVRFTSEEHLMRVIDRIVSASAGGSTRRRRWSTPACPTGRAST